MVSSATHLQKPPVSVHLIFLNLNFLEFGKFQVKCLHSTCPRLTLSPSIALDLHQNYLWGLFNMQTLRFHPDSLSDFTGSGTQCLRLIEAPRQRFAALTNPSLSLACDPRLPRLPRPRSSCGLLSHKPALGEPALPPPVKELVS